MWYMDGSIRALGLPEMALSRKFEEQGQIKFGNLHWIMAVILSFLHRKQLCKLKISCISNMSSFSEKEEIKTMNQYALLRLRQGFYKYQSALNA